VNRRRLPPANRAILLSRSDDELTTPYEPKLIRLPNLQLILNRLVKDNNPPWTWIVVCGEWAQQTPGNRQASCEILVLIRVLNLYANISEIHSDAV
jgi:hypothetical protein